MGIPGDREKPPADVSCEKDPAAVARSVLSKNGISIPVEGAVHLGKSSDNPDSVKVDSTPKSGHVPSYKDSLMGLHGSYVNKVGHENSSPEVNALLPELLNQNWELPEPSDDMKLLMDIYPSMQITQEELNRWARPWNTSLVITILGAKVNFFRLKEHLHKIWQSNGFDLIDLPNNYYVVKFKDQANCEQLYKKILFGGPWTVAQHSILVQRWSPFFDPLKNPLGRVATWVRIPNVPLLCYNKECLWRMGDMIGKTIKVDMNTMENPDDKETTIHRGRYARLCVEVDLQKELVSRIITASNLFNIEYEGLGLICFGCGRYGHRKEQCSFSLKPEGLATVKSSSSEKDKPLVQNLCTTQNPPSSSSSMVPPVLPPPAKDQPYGPWMLVRRRASSHLPRSSVSSAPSDKLCGQTHLGTSSQSRFAVLSGAGHVEGSTSHQFSNLGLGSDKKIEQAAVMSMAEGKIRKGNRVSFGQHPKSKGVHVGRRKIWTERKSDLMIKPNPPAIEKEKELESNVSPNIPPASPTMKPKKAIKTRTHNLVRGSLTDGPIKIPECGIAHEEVDQPDLTCVLSDLNHSPTPHNDNHRGVDPTPLSMVIPSESVRLEKSNYLESMLMPIAPLKLSNPNQELLDHGSELRSVSQLEVVVLMEDKSPDK